MPLFPGTVEFYVLWGKIMIGVGRIDVACLKSLRCQHPVVSFQAIGNKFFSHPATSWPHMIVSHTRNARRAVSPEREGSPNAVYYKLSHPGAGTERLLSSYCTPTCSHECSMIRNINLIKFWIKTFALSHTALLVYAINHWRCFERAGTSLPFQIISAVKNTGKSSTWWD